MCGFIFLVLATLLLFAWAGAFIVYHLAGFLIHVLLVLALLSFIVHLFTGGKRPV